jgi:aryl-alcohol dehydrogenase-like predicted oxidoreductase
MNLRKLGPTSFNVSEIGFGAWGIGGSMWRGVDDAQSRETLHAALDEGVTFIDTALAYGNGHSERLIAEVLATRADPGRAVVATKIPPMDHSWPGKASTPFASAFPARHVEKCVEASLENLRVKSLDVEQFHVWHDAWLDSPDWQETRAAMQRLKDTGKVLHWGVSINDHAPETAMRLLCDPIIETAQVIYNIFDRSPERELFALAREKPLGVIVRVPFDEGVLTGSIGPETTFPEGDWRHRYFGGDRKHEAAKRAKALQALLGVEARTLPELALRFCLTPTEVSTVIPGMRRPQHARANAAVSDGRALSPGMLDLLRPHAWKKNWYAGN